MPEQQKNNGLRDVAIIGAGPVGLFAVFECGMVGLTCHVIDALPEIGGQCSALYPEKPIYDIPAYPEIAAADLIAQLEKQAQAFDPAYHLNQQVVSISNINSLWHLKTSSGAEITAKAIIIAGGAGAFGPNKPPLEGIESYENISVFYMVRQKSVFSGKNIVIAGGGDSAVDWALSLAPIAKSVQLVHRRDKFRAAPESIKKLQDLLDKDDKIIKLTRELRELERKLSDEKNKSQTRAVSPFNVDTSQIPKNMCYSPIGLCNNANNLGFQVNSSI